ncbi:MAG: hypothetical protein COA88_15760 [Kordia sp.]|nr:MAG: hypothetical protein COA88_15760 [Kordia sp.]
MIDKSLILNNIKGCYNIKRDTDFAEFLGIKKQTLSAWHSRNTFDIYILYSKCKKITPHYLFTGTGEMLLNEDRNEATENINSLKDYSPSEISVHIHNNKEDFDINPVYQLLRENDIKNGVIELMTKKLEEAQKKLNKKEIN